MSSINLFGLPIVVLRNVFSQFGPAEIFTISLCSKRAQQNLQYVMPSNTVNLSLTAFENNFTIECSRGDHDLTFRGSLEPVDDSEYTVNTDGGSVPVSFIDTTVFVIGVVNAFKAILNYICKIFRSEIRILVFTGMEFSEENISYIISETIVTEEIFLKFDSSNSEARIQLRPMSLRRFESFHSPWFTMENLLSLNVETARVYSTQLTSRDMNTFLKHWVQGGCGRLLEMYLELGLYMDVDFVQVLKGIDFQRVEQKEATEYFSDYLSGFVGTHGGFKIRRQSDGKVALLLDNRLKSSFFNLLVDCE